MTSKNDIRSIMRSRRKALAPAVRERASETICEKLIQDSSIAAAVDPIDGAGALAVYLASDEEIDLSRLVDNMLGRGVTVVSPRWNGESYDLARLRSLAERDMRRGPMHILEPAEADVADPKEVAAWIVPGLAFTTDGKRLGYGGGWYDRLLSAARSGSLKIGVAHGFQVVGDLPSEPHDIRLDRIVTDSSP